MKNQLTSNSQLETWSVPECPLKIEYSRQLLRDICSYALDQKVNGEPVDAGGVLFGARKENTIRLTTWRHIPCEHAQSAHFRLSENDRRRLNRLLQGARTEPALIDLHPVGWFVSHREDGVQLNPYELKIYEHFFPWTWQATLVLHREENGAVRAGFFARDADKAVRTEASYQEFSIDAPAPARPVEAPAPAPSVTMTSTPDPTQRQTARLPAPNRTTRDRSRWIWAAPVLLACLVAAAIFFERPAPPAPTFSFRIGEKGGDLHLQWDETAEPIRDAARGKLDIKDGNNPRLQVPLDVEKLRDGSLDYPRKSGDVEVLMTVDTTSGTKVQESARFLGSPVPKPAAVATPTPPASASDKQLRQQRDALAAEVARLREQLSKTDSRNAQLEDTIRILEHRIQVEELRTKPRKPVATQ